ncbi:uncharacterized protein [Haliotis asinina]|uniref:uncharacterized protein n=1 Tax=Haliotis asinina TaxID=109174 RepID=UPI003532381A
MPPKTKHLRRGYAWTDDETKCLLSIWGDMHIQSQLDSPSKADTAVYSKVSKAMNELGFEKTAPQCKERMKTLKKAYRQCRDSLKRSGQPRKLCKFYEELNEILDTRPATSPGKVIESLQQSVASDTDLSDPEVTDNHVTDTIADDVELTDPGDDEFVENVKNDQQNNNMKTDRTKDETQMKQKGKQRKTKLQTTLETVMDKFAKSNEDIEARQIELEKKQIDLEMRKIDDEREKREFELRKQDKKERQKASDREHQLRMLQLIMNTRQPYAIPSSTQCPPMPRPPIDPVYDPFQETVPGTSSGATSPVISDYTKNHAPHHGQERTRGSVTQEEDGNSYYNI